MKLFSTICVAFYFVFSGLSFAGEFGIDWEVKHRFRFFNAAPDESPSIFFKMQQKAWNELLDSDDFDLNDAVSLMELKLNDQKWLQKFYKENRRELGINKNEMDRGGHAKWGWSKHVIRNNKTCWDSRQQWHSSCKSDALGAAKRTDYVKPQRHTVIARVSNLDNPSNYQCIWSVDISYVFLGKSPRTKSVQKNCSETVEMRIPFRPNKKTGISKSTLVRLKVKEMPENTANARISVRDILVVGLGDSYSSGEGNPDVPVIMDPFPSDIKNGVVHNAKSYNPLAFNSDRTKLIKARNHPDHELPNNRRINAVVPHRQNISSPAKWLDRNCHRSLYSYHARTALQLALETNKRTAVTYLGFACSGAKLTAGILLDYDGIEHVNKKYLSTKGRQRRVLPQVARLIEELCAEQVSLQDDDLIEIMKLKTGKTGEDVETVKLPSCGNGKPEDFLRPIDVFMLGIGGNDVGFLPIIVDAVLSDTQKFNEAGVEIKVRKGLLASLGTMFIGHDTTFAEKERLPQLPLRFSAFHTAIKKIGLPIKENSLEGDLRKNVFLTTFPRIERNQDGNICAFAGDNPSNERKIEVNREIIAGMTLQRTSKWLSLNGEKMKKASEFSDKLKQAIEKAANDNSFVLIDDHREEFRKHGLCAQADDAATNPYERMLAPFYAKSNALGNNWHRKFNANNYDCYRSRQRWVRSFDDAFFCANTIHGRYPSRRGRDEISVAFMSLGGPIHPTAEGHSHIADAVMGKLRKLRVINSQFDQVE